MKESTSKFKVEEIVYDNGEFAIARGYWDGEPQRRLACRWYEDGGIGYPQTFGKPQWMLIPEEDVSVEVITSLDPSLKKVAITFA